MCTTVAEGAQLLVVQTNNAAFGYSAETEQQLAMSRLRAVEHGRDVLVMATSGVSAVIAPDGSVRQRAEVYTAATLLDDVGLRDELTPATRYGGPIEAGLTALALAPLPVLAVRRRRRLRRLRGEPRIQPLPLDAKAPRAGNHEATPRGSGGHR